MKAEFSRLNKLAMAVPRLKQSTRLAEKHEKEEAVRLQLQSEPVQPSKGKGQGNFYFMINRIHLACIITVRCLSTINWFTFREEELYRHQHDGSSKNSEASRGNQPPESDTATDRR